MSSRRTSLGMVLAVFTMLWVAGYMLASMPAPVAWGLMAPGGLGLIGYNDGVAALRYADGIVLYDGARLYQVGTGRFDDSCLSNDTVIYTMFSPPRIGLAVSGGQTVNVYDIPEYLPQPSRTICSPVAGYAIGADRLHDVTIYAPKDGKLVAYGVKIGDTRLLDAGIWQDMPLLHTTSGLYLIDLDTGTVYKLDPHATSQAGLEEIQLGGIGDGYVWYTGDRTLVVVGDRGNAMAIRGIDGWRVEAASPDGRRAYITPVTGWGLIVDDDGSAYRVGFSDAMIPTASGFTGEGGFWLGGFLVAWNSTVLLRIDALGEYRMGWGYRVVAWVEPAGVLSVERFNVDWSMEPAGSVEAMEALTPSVSLPVEPVDLGVKVFGVSWDPVSRFFTALALGIAFSSVLHSLLEEE